MHNAGSAAAEPHTVHTTHYIMKRNIRTIRNNTRPTPTW